MIKLWSTGFQIFYMVTLLGQMCTQSISVLNDELNFVSPITVQCFCTIVIRIQKKNVFIVKGGIIANIKIQDRKKHKFVQDCKYI